MAKILWSGGVNDLQVEVTKQAADKQMADLSRQYAEILEN